MRNLKKAKQTFINYQSGIINGNFEGCGGNSSCSNCDTIGFRYPTCMEFLIKNKMKILGGTLFKQQQIMRWFNEGK